ncbi:MAG: DUF3854 domain-containing protein [Bacillota bacterium]
MLDITTLSLRRRGRELVGDCPFCQDRRHHLHVNLAKGVYHCFRCGASGKVKGGDKSPAKSLPPVLPVRESASVEVLDHAYHALLSVLVLSSEHREHLLSRGLSAAQVSALAYRTMPKAGRTRIAERVSAVAGEVAGVPGFYLYKEGVWCLAGPPGILVPVRDFEGRIHGVQIRRTGEIEGPRYVWLSSQGDDRRPRPGGTPAKATYHVAGATLTGRVWITEGPIKADISAMLLGETVIAVPGVNAWEGSGLLDALKKHTVTEAVIAFDADLATNKWVTRSAWKLYRTLRRSGITARFADWDPEDGKGLDDLLVAGKKPKVLSAPAWREKHAALLGRRKEDRMNRVILAGRLAAKPVVSQGKVLHVRLEVVEERDDETQNQREQRPIPIHAWRQTAEKVAAMNLGDGDFVFIEGYIGFGYMRDDAGNELRPIQVNALNVHRVGVGQTSKRGAADHVADEGGIEIPW